MKTCFKDRASPTHSLPRGGPTLAEPVPAVLNHPDRVQSQDLPLQPVRRT